MTRVWRGVALALLLLAAAGGAAEARSHVTLDVPAGRFKTVRLLNVPAGATLGVDVRTSELIVVVVVDAENVRRFPDVRRRLYRGYADPSLAFTLRVRTAGTYYLVLDNRAGATVRHVSVTVRWRRSEETSRGGTPAA